MTDGSHPQPWPAPHPGVIAFFAGKPAGRVLNISSENGHHALPLLRDGHEVVAYAQDPSEDRFLRTEARVQGFHKLTAYVVGLWIKKPRGQFDYIVIEHSLTRLPMETRLQALALYPPAMKPGGTYVIIAEDDDLAEYSKVLLPGRENLPVTRCAGSAQRLAIWTT